MMTKFLVEIWMFAVTSEMWIPDKKYFKYLGSRLKLKIQVDI